MANRSAKKSSKSPTLILVAVLIGVLAMGTKYVLGFFAGPPDFPGPGSGRAVITVHAGDSLSVVGNTLKAARVVASVDAFVQAANENAESQSMQPGTYTLRSEMKASEALALILSRETRNSNAVIIREGLTVREIVSVLAKHTNISNAEWKSALGEVTSYGLPPYAHGKPEGYLFPATYEITENQSAQQILSTMTGTFKRQVDGIDFLNGAAKLKLIPEKVLTVASLIQAESHPRDFAKVSRVVYNRLSSGMRLQFDSTVNYGLGKSHVILNDSQLAQDTPYNTYLHDGLPPTPINNPGLEAIKAALHPEKGNWLFFVTVNLKTQETKFTDSYDQFLVYKNEFLRWCQQNPGECSK